MIQIPLTEVQPSFAGTRLSVLVLALAPPVLQTTQTQTLCEALAQWGFDAQVLSELPQALPHLAQHPTHVLLLDGAYGFDQHTQDVLLAIRNLVVEHPIYIIALVQAMNAETVVQALDAGADDVLAKPIDHNELEARLYAALRRLHLARLQRQRTADLSIAHDKLTQDLRAVSRLQASFLPTPSRPTDAVFYHAQSIPSVHVSGDHLQVFALNPNTYAFYVLDVSGHGVPAAVKSMQLAQMFADKSEGSIVFEPGAHTPAGEPMPAAPHAVVARLNHMFQQTDADSSYFTILYGTLNVTTRRVCFCQAGHPPLLWLKPGGSVVTLGDGGFPVGLFEDAQYTDVCVTLDENDALLMYSDGVTEVQNAEEALYGAERLSDCVSMVITQGGYATVVPSIVNAIQHWGGEPVARTGFQDDISLLLLTFQAMPAANAQDQPTQYPTHKTSGVVAFRKAVSHMPVVRRILVVDDSRSFLRIFEAMLLGWGYEVLCVKNGNEALEAMHKQRPDFVLSDWDMPGMSGIELCQAIRSDSSLDDVIVLMVTGFASRDDLLHSLKAGADDFVTKPVNPAELKLRLRSAERIARVYAELSAQHAELQELHEALQRDMREVSRMQRAMLPKPQTSPWPCALQTLHQPQGYVSGLHMGLLHTNANEYGFFMVHVHGQNTTAALRAMTLARWFSVAKATEVLFPLDDTCSKPRRHLANVAEVAAHMAKALNMDDTHPEHVDIEVLYGLLNTDQGALLLAGIGQWHAVLVHETNPEADIYFCAIEHAFVAPGASLYQGIIRPGTRLYLMPTTCAHMLELNTPEQWQPYISTHLGAITKPNQIPLDHEFGLLTARIPPPSQALGDILLAGLQWRETHEVALWVPTETETKALQAELADIARNCTDSFVTHPVPIELGPLESTLYLKTVCDPHTIFQACQHVREHLLQLNKPEESVYAIELVLSEALSNIAYHGFKHDGMQGQAPKPCTIALVVHQDATALMLQDQGQCIPEAVLQRLRDTQTYFQDTELQQLPEGGMGLYFMRLMTRRFVVQAFDAHNRMWFVV